MIKTLKKALSGNPAESEPVAEPIGDRLRKQHAQAVAHEATAKAARDEAALEAELNPGDPMAAKRAQAAQEAHEKAKARIAELAGAQRAQGSREAQAAQAAAEAALEKRWAKTAKLASERLEVAKAAESAAAAFSDAMNRFHAIGEQIAAVCPARIDANSHMFGRIATAALRLNLFRLGQNWAAPEGSIIGAENIKPFTAKIADGNALLLAEKATPANRRDAE